MLILAHSLRGLIGGLATASNTNNTNSQSGGVEHLHLSIEMDHCARATGTASEQPMAMERRCHTADHSLSAESCNGTSLQGILVEF